MTYQAYFDNQDYILAEQESEFAKYFAEKFRCGSEISTTVYHEIMAKYDTMSREGFLGRIEFQTLIFNAAKFKQFLIVKQHAN